jgi:hypothetical protein
MSREAQVASIERQFGDRIESAIGNLGIERNALVAVFAIETGGKEALWNGVPLVRIEAHLICRKAPEAAARFRFDAKEPWKAQQVHVAGRWENIHTGDQANEWVAIEAAKSYLSDEDIYQCCSWGAAQIMGFNHKRCGFSSATAMTEAFVSLDQQLRAFLSFVRTGKNMMTALKTRDWRMFAREYNGPGQVEQYAKWMGEAYEACRKSDGD